MAYKPTTRKPKKYQESDAVKQAQDRYNKWKDSALTDFKYDDFKTSDKTNNLQSQLDALKKPGEFQYGRQEEMDALFDKIMNRKEFQYDVNSDALYQQYKDRYINQGKMAMMDTMGQAAAKTGGYGNTYAQMAGQQAYQEHLKGLGDKIPELYQMALNKYRDDGNDMRNSLGLYRDDLALKYGQYRDDVADFNADRNYLANRYDTSYSQDMSAYEANRNNALAQNESHNNNIMANRDFYGKDYYNRYDRDYGAYKDYEAMQQAAAEMANNNYYRDQQLAMDREKFAFDKAYKEKQMAAAQAAAQAAEKEKADKERGYSGLDAFKASIKTPAEFKRRNGGDYKAYVEQTLEKWANGSGPDGIKLTDDEIYQIMSDYGLL